MRRLTGILRNPALALVLVLVTAGPARADDDDTMMVIDEGATPEDIVRVIELPKFATPKGQEKAKANAGVGQDLGPEDKLSGKEFGQQIAEEAKSKSQSASEDVRQNEGRDRGRGRGRGNN